MPSGDLHISLIRVSRLHRRRSGAQFSQHGISPGQPRLLEYLNHHDGCIQRQLAEDCNLEPASVSSVLSSMEREGIIRRVPVDDDRRALRVWLTDIGREKHQIVAETFHTLEEECFSDFNEEEKELAKQFLQRMYENMKQGEDEYYDKTGEIPERRPDSRHHGASPHAGRGVHGSDAADFDVGHHRHRRGER